MGLLHIRFYTEILAVPVNISFLRDLRYDLIIFPACQKPSCLLKQRKACPQYRPGQQAGYNRCRHQHRRVCGHCLSHQHESRQQLPGVVRKGPADARKG